MKIKMIRHYHGKLSNKETFVKGKEYDVPSEAGQELVDRGFAEAMKAAPAPKKATDK